MTIGCLLVSSQWTAHSNGFYFASLLWLQFAPLSSQKSSIDYYHIARQSALSSDWGVIVQTIKKMAWHRVLLLNISIHLSSFYDSFLDYLFVHKEVWSAVEYIIHVGCKNGIVFYFSMFCSVYII